MTRLTLLYKEYAGAEPARVEEITGSGSNRAYYRLFGTDGKTVIGCIGTNREENHAFLYLARHFASKGLPVPTVLAVSDDELCYLQNDLGNRSLFDALKAGREAGGRYNAYERELLRRTIAWLPKLQLWGGEGLDFSQCYPQPAMDKTSILFDLNYFKYCYLKLTGMEFNEYKLEADFQQLAEDLLSSNTDYSSPSPAGEGRGGVFLYRDFQARNVMLDADDQPWFIDFQGGRRGPIYYDLASFLWQASSKFPEDLREELLEVYWDSSAHSPLLGRGVGGEAVRLFVLFRLLQVLGAYGFRGLWEKKQHFIDSIPPALANLQQELAKGTCDKYPYLKEVLNTLTPALSLKGEGALKSQSTLASSKTDSKTPSPCGEGWGGVRVFSFSYKRGIPADESGNGGGYVFDCRSSNNPGRYPEYKQLTGLDQPVIDFLEQDGEILDFLSHIYPLADFHVQRWIDRGFTDLMFSFGCTGGQHRSVYCAQHLAEHIHQKFGIPVHLCHREQGISQTLE